MGASPPGPAGLPLDPAARARYEGSTDQFNAELLLEAHELAIDEHRTTILAQHVRRRRSPGTSAARSSSISRS